MTQKGYIDDRSFNLRNYIREDGKIYSLEEVMDSRAENELDINVTLNKTKGIYQLLTCF